MSSTSSPGAGGRGLGKNECDAMNKTILSRTIFRWRWQRTPNYSTATAVPLQSACSGYLMSPAALPRLLRAVLRA